MKNINLLCMFAILFSCQVSNKKSHANLPDEETVLTPGVVVNESLASEWRLLDLENTLYMNLDSGTVIIELFPQMAPLHVENTKALIRQGIFDNTQFYRVIDGFVAQGGPLFESIKDRPILSYGEYNVPSELTIKSDLGDEYVSFDQDDGYADETGFLRSFPIGRTLKNDNSSGKSWMLHCYGALGMGRANELDSGATELYIVNGHAQRYLDRNVTIFGRVIDGMPHIQALQRSVDLNGAVDLLGKNIIRSIQVAADMPKTQGWPIEVMDTNSQSFRKLLKARKNRTSEWFVHQHDYMDACGVPIPVRLRK